MDGFTYLQETVKLILICQYSFHVEISLLSQVKTRSQLKYSGNLNLKLHKNLLRI